VRIGFKTSPRGVEWSALDETWALAGTLDVFEAGWMNDHLTDMLEERGGRALEALTALATLVHHVPGKWVGHAVLSNTFRHPAVLAKAATVLDQATQGRFILGLGAGWHEGEQRCSVSSSRPCANAWTGSSRHCACFARCSPTKRGSRPG
jgi:alkanesulfonate monooxygenase SsuD/methylene tetrahydromethanopterin reductase-like flavin-dependent oxidoreductase (luciferase family)